jgi:hypothetical protein
MRSTLSTILALCVLRAFTADFGAFSGQDFGMELVYPRQSTNSLASFFSGALGGVPAGAITNSGNSARPFSVAGDTFVSDAGKTVTDELYHCGDELAYEVAP